MKDQAYIRVQRRKARDRRRRNREIMARRAARTVREQQQRIDGWLRSGDKKRIKRLQAA